MKQTKPQIMQLQDVPRQYTPLQYTPLKYTPMDELAHIKAEVRQHGFCSAKLNKFIIEASNRDDIVELMTQTAQQANLKVSFNFKLRLCVFEAE